MSTTGKDRVVARKQWTDVNAGTYAKGMVQNKTGHQVFVAFGAAAPTETEHPRGQVLAPGKFTLFDAEANVWCFCEFGGLVHVQDVS